MVPGKIEQFKSQIYRRLIPKRLVDLERIVNAIPLSIVVLDRNLKIVMRNTMFGNMFDDQEKKIIGQSVLEVLPPEFFHKKRLGRKYIKYIHSDQPKEIREVECFLPTGKKIINIRTVKMERRKGAHVILLMDDVTEKVQLGESLRWAQKMSALGQFVAGIVHEINNPLSIIDAQSQYLLEKFQKLERRKLSSQKFNDLIETLRTIRRNSERCGRVTKNLLLFGRKEIKPRKWLIDIKELLDEILSIFGRQFELSRIKVACQMSPLPLILADPFQIDQVFMNLLLNARQAMPQGGKLMISTRKVDEQWIEIKIADTGVGIPQEHMNRVFEPFFTSRKPGEGTGLGLSVAYSIIKDHRGTIKIHSEVGQGTTIIITLPIPHNKREGIFPQRRYDRAMK